MSAWPWEAGGQVWGGSEEVKEEAAFEWDHLNKLSDGNILHLVVDLNL